MKENMENSKSGIRPTGAHFNLASILAGFSFTLGIEMLTRGNQSLVAILSIVALLASGCLLLGMTLYYFMTTPFADMIDRSMDKERIEKYLVFQARAQNIFFAGMFFLFLGIALAAWTHSTLVGIAITLSAILSAFLAANYGGAVVLIGGDLYDKLRESEEEEEGSTTPS